MVLSIQTKKLLQFAVAAVLALSVLASPALVSATDGSIEETGPDSSNVIEFNDSSSYVVENNILLHADNDNDQDADSGDAESTHNTTGGDATSGDAENDNSLSADVEVDNTTSGDVAGTTGNSDHDASIETTGPDSHNKVEVNSEHHVNVENNTSISIKNDNDQDAESGDAEVSDSTTGGDATSGDASNTNETELSFSVSN